MRVLLPTSTAYTPAKLTDMFTAIGRAFGRVYSKDEPIKDLIWESADGSRFRETMGNDGVKVITPL
jgi:hypothetical protein